MDPLTHQRHVKQARDEVLAAGAWCPDDGYFYLYRLGLHGNPSHLPWAMRAGEVNVFFAAQIAGGGCAVYRLGQFLIHTARLTGTPLAITLVGMFAGITSLARRAMSRYRPLTPPPTDDDTTRPGR